MIHYQYCFKILFQLFTKHEVFHFHRRLFPQMIGFCCMCSAVTLYETSGFLVISFKLSP